MHHLCHGVDVARTHGDPHRAGAGGRLLRRSPVLPAGREHGALVGDVVCLGERLDLGHQPLVGDEARIADMEAEAFALGRGAVLFRHAGRVAGKRDVDADADVGLDGVGRGAGAAQADLLLCGEDHVDFRTTALIRPERADRLDPEPAGDAVVECLGDELVTQFQKGLVHHHVIAHPNRLGRVLAQPGVDEEIGDERHLLALFGRGDMHGLAAGVHHRPKVAILGADEDPAGKEVARIEAAHRQDGEEALLRYVADKKADLVHVAQEHDLGRAILGGIAAAMERAHRIGADLVKKARHLRLDERTHPLLMTGHARGFAEPFQKVDVHRGILAGLWRSWARAGRDAMARGEVPNLPRQALIPKKLLYRG